MATQVATTEVITGTTSDNITADEKLDNDDNARVLEDETKTEVQIVNAASDSAVAEEDDEQKALLHGPAILSSPLRLQQEVDEDNNPSRLAVRVSSRSHDGGTPRRSSSADNGDQVPTGQLGRLLIRQISCEMIGENNPLATRRRRPRHWSDNSWMIGCVKGKKKLLLH
jgi:hypothetical protein